MQTQYRKKGLHLCAVRNSSQEELVHFMEGRVKVGEVVHMCMGLRVTASR